MSPGEAAPMSALTPMTLTSYDGPAGMPEASASLDPAEFLATIEPGLPARSACKRVIDVVGALGGLIFLLPILAVVAFLIRVDSRGPILFRQKRMGFGG